MIKNNLFVYKILKYTHIEDCTMICFRCVSHVKKSSFPCLVSGETGVKSVRGMFVIPVFAR